MAEPEIELLVLDPQEYPATSAKISNILKTRKSFLIDEPSFSTIVNEYISSAKRILKIHVR